MRKAFVFIVGILLICEGLSARDKSEKMCRVSFGAAAGWAYLLGLDDYAQELIHSHRTLFYTLNVAYRALPGDSSLYDSAFGYPMLEGGFLLPIIVIYVCIWRIGIRLISRGLVIWRLLMVHSGGIL